MTDKEVIAIDQDPLGKQGYRYKVEEGKETWAKELSDGAWAVCILNATEKPMDVEVNWNKLNFLLGTYQIRDLWQKKDLGKSDVNYTCMVASHDVALFKLTPMK